MEKPELIQVRHACVRERGRRGTVPYVKTMEMQTGIIKPNILLWEGNGRWERRLVDAKFGSFGVLGKVNKSHFPKMSVQYCGV